MAGDARAARRRPTPAERRAQSAAVEDPAVVLDAAARLLEARARSVAEVRRRLTQAGYRPDLIDGTVERLLGLGILDDDAFARAWVESRDRAHPRGARALRDELRRKGIVAGTVEAILAERDESAAAAAVTEAAVTEASIESAGPASRSRREPPVGGRTGARETGADEIAARRLIARHAAALDRVADPRRRRQRAYALLARNGFEPDVIAAAVRELDQAWDAGGTNVDR